MMSNHIGKWALGIWTTLIFGFMLVPVFIIVILAFNESALGLFPFTGVTTHWFVVVLTDKDLMRSLMNSFRISLVASVFATILGSASAYALARYRFYGRAVTEMTLTLPLLIPHLVMGVSLLLLFKALGVDKSMTTLTLGHIVMILPFVVLTVRHRFDSIPLALEEAAWTLGANRVQGIRQVVLPLAIPSILTGLLFSFMYSFDEVTATIFWRPVNVETVQTQIMAMLQYEVDQRVNALAALLILFSIGIPVLGLVLARLVIRNHKV